MSHDRPAQLSDCFPGVKQGVEKDVEGDSRVGVQKVQACLQDHCFVAVIEVGIVAHVVQERPRTVGCVVWQQLQHLQQERKMALEKQLSVRAKECHQFQVSLFVDRLIHLELKC